MPKKIILPQEGDLIFAHKNLFQNIWSREFLLLEFEIMLGVFASAMLIDSSLRKNFLFNTGPWVVVMLFILIPMIFIGLLSFAQFLLVFILGFKRGFSDESYEGFYFRDRIVFYRISKYVDEVYTEKKSKEELLQEIKSLEIKINEPKKRELELRNISDRAKGALEDAARDDSSLNRLNDRISSFNIKRDYLLKVADEKKEEFRDGINDAKIITLYFECMKLRGELDKEISDYNIKEEKFENEVNRFSIAQKELLEILKQKLVLTERLSKLKIGVNVAENLGKPHKIELPFTEVKYFMNEKDGIKVVKNDLEEENQLDLFYNKVALQKKYRKNKSGVIEFLNKRVEEVKKSVPADFYGIKKYILSLLSGINTLVFHKWCIIFYHSEYS